MNKYNNLLGKMKNCYLCYSSDFNATIAFHQTLDIIVYHWPTNPICKFFIKLKQKVIFEYLNKHMKDYLNSFDTTDEVHNSHFEKAPIWQCWWQGEEGLEGVTKICTESVKTNANGHPVILITKANFRDFVTLPQDILDKLEVGTITLTTFSDILRFNLIWQNGGLWIDTTVLVTSPLKEEIFKFAFFSTKEQPRNCYYASNFRWSSFVVGGLAGNVVCKYESQAFYDYWKKENKLIDYYLIDYLLELGYQHYDNIRSTIDAIPYNNPQKHSMQSCLNLPYSKEVWAQLTTDTQIFKLSRKTDYRKYTDDGKKTLFGHLSGLYLKIDKII